MYFFLLHCFSLITNLKAIIEALKYAITGTMPPGVRSGQALIIIQNLQVILMTVPLSNFNVQTEEENLWLHIKIWRLPKRMINYHLKL
jgi:hypothetical protein